MSPTDASRAADRASRSQNVRGRVLLAIPREEIASVSAALRERSAALEVWAWADVPSTGKVDCLLVWNPTSAQIAHVAENGFVQAYGAGVDRILSHPDLPAHMPVARIVDPLMTAGMTQHVLLAILRHFRHADTYRRQQEAAEWIRLPHPDPRRCTIGIMGLGVLGSAIANTVLQLGFPVRAWSRRRRDLAGTICYAGQAKLAEFLGGTDMLVCLLPETAGTRGLVNAESLNMLPRGAYLISCGRGAVVVESDLLAALDSGHLAGAALDVFEREPLAPDSRLWRHPKIVVTPHIATFPVADAVASQLIDNLGRVSRGEAVAYPADRNAGY